MLRAGIRVTEAMGLGPQVSRPSGGPNGSRSPTKTFDAVTFTYLLRYVDDRRRPCVSSPGSFDPAARLASLDFFPSRRAAVPRRLVGLHALVMPVIGRSYPGVALHGPVPRAEHQRVLRSVSAPGADPMVARRAGCATHVCARQASFIWAREGRAACPLTAHVTTIVQGDRQAIVRLLRAHARGLRDYWTLLHPPYTLGTCRMS